MSLNKQNHFTKFSFEESFNIDIDDLESKYLDFQKIFHPDKLIGKSKAQQIELEHNSFLINEAYEILKDPLTRAIYLLKLRGINIDDDSCEIKPDQETLIKNLELRELIFESDNKDELQEVKKSCQKEMKLVLKDAQKDFENQDYQQAALNLIKAKYLGKSIIEIKRKK